MKPFRFAAFITVMFTGLVCWTALHAQETDSAGQGREEGVESDAIAADGLGDVGSDRRADGMGRHVIWPGGAGSRSPQTEEGNARRIISDPAEIESILGDEARRLIHDAPSAAGSGTRSPQQTDESFRQRLQARLVGQPEVVELFANIERRELKQGPNHRNAPEIVYLTGLVGTGLKTAPKAYIDAKLWEGAHSEHMFRLPIAKSEADVWQAFGAKTGYIGSFEVSHLIRFLVNHSSGRYRIELSGKDGDENRSEYVVEDRYWKPRVPHRGGTFSPEEAVVLVENFQSWSKEAKDAFFLTGFRGTFPIGAPGQGVREIHVPVTFIITSTEGTEFLASRNMDGVKVGRSLRYDQQIAKWARFHQRKDLIIKSMNSQSLIQSGAQYAAGISDSLVSKIPRDNILLLRPLSPADLREIANRKISALESTYAAANGVFGSIALSLDHSVVDFLAEYDLDPEQGGLSIDANAKVLDDSILEAVFAHADSTASGHHVSVSIKRNGDMTYSIHAIYAAQNRDPKEFDVLLKSTSKEKPIERMAEERIDEISQLAGNMKRRVFGVEPIAHKIQEAVLVSEERYHALSLDKDSDGAPATIFMFLGPSSTGKTQTGKELAASLPGGKESLKVIDFSNVRTVQDIKDKILGSKDQYGRVRKSEFMEHYDRHDGRILIIADEMPRASLEALNALLEIFREPIVAFADGEARKMGGVTIAVTGNAGEESYKGIPRDIPKFMQMFAMQEVYDEVMRDPGYRRHILERSFSEPLINRIGESNIFFYSPLTFKAIRELSMLKLDIALKGLLPTASRWGWHVAFASHEDYDKLLDVIETDGYVIREQGASIDRFVTGFERQVRNVLLLNKIKPGTNVAIAFDRFEVIEEEQKRHSHWTIHVEGSDKPLQFRTEGLQDNRWIKQSDEAQILTAYHEVGHELVRKVVLDGKYRAVRISIIPGVGRSGDEWIHYLGVSDTEPIEYYDQTRDRIIAKIASILAGEVAESLVATQYTGGKSNDIRRATEYAQKAIIDLGLSRRWGNYARSGDMSVFIATLTEARRSLLEAEVKALLDEGADLARRVILQNYDTHFVPMSIELAEKGEMFTKDIEAHYEKNALVVPKARSAFAKALSRYDPRKVAQAVTSFFTAPKTPDAALLDSTPRPASVANIYQIIEERRAEQVKSVEPLLVPVVNDATIFPSLTRSASSPVAVDQARVGQSGGLFRGDGCEGHFAQ